MKFKTFLTFGIIFLFSSIFAFAALDLAFVGNITQSPDPATTGASTTFSVSFRTNGGAVTNMKITGGVDGTQLFTRTYASIGADLTRTDTFNWPATAGNHTIWFVLDPGHTCGDSNYANNRIEKAITIGGGTPAGKPDLYISSVTLTPFKFSAGDPVTLKIIVSNKETADAPQSSLFMKNDKEKVLMAMDIPAIGKGSQYEHTITWTGTCGTVLTIVVDSIKKADELDESNNRWVQTMNCGLLRQLDSRIFNPRYMEDPNGPDLQPVINMFNNNPPLTDQEQLMYFAVIVNNLGKSISRTCSMRILLNGKIIQTLVVGSINSADRFKPYESHTASAKLKCNDELSVVVDYDLKNRESNESNNQADKKLECPK